MNRNSVILHPELVVLLSAMANDPQPPYEDLSPDQARAMSQAFSPPLAQPVCVGQVANRALPGPGGALMCRIYTPEHADTALLPGVVFLHGGGWVICDLDTHDDICRRLCQAMHAVVISIDYRLSPEVRFPGAVDDAIAALNWTIENGVSLGIDPELVFVAGDSAGANLATVAALALRDAGNHTPLGQILFYPVTDLSTEHPSYAEAEGLPLTASTMRWFRRHYLEPENAGNDEHVSPLNATSLAGLPPAFVLTVQYDPLRDEGVAYAQRLAREGVRVTHVHYHNQIHGFLSMAAHLSDGPAALAMAANWAQSIIATAAWHRK